MQLKTYDELYKTSFSPDLEVMKIHWYIPVIQPKFAENLQKTEEKHEEIPKEASTELQTTIDYHIKDITPKKTFWRR